VALQEYMLINNRVELIRLVTYQTLIRYSNVKKEVLII
jgi:hypothetical protein